LTECVFQLATNAKSHLYAARQRQSTLPNGSAAFLLPAVPADRWLNALENVNFNIFDQRIQQWQQQGLEPIKLRYSLFKHSRQNTF